MTFTKTREQICFGGVFVTLFEKIFIKHLINLEI